jgi:hypothetical protein
MNYFDNINKMNNNYPIMPQPQPFDINYKINELENKIKKLELRISYLETEKNSNYIEPDQNLYMI